MGYNIKPVLTESFVSTNDLSSYQYYGVKLSADRTVILPTADTDIPIGILQNKPTAGQMAEVMVIGRTPVKIAEALTAGQEIRIASGGLAALAEVSDTTTYVVGQVVEHAGVSGEIAEAVVNFTNLMRAG
jgi:hypothetical protein